MASVNRLRKYEEKLSKVVATRNLEVGLEPASCFVRKYGILMTVRLMDIGTKNDPESGELKQIIR